MSPLDNRRPDARSRQAVSNDQKDRPQDVWPDGAVTRRGRTQTLDFAVGFDRIAAEMPARSFHPLLPLFETLLSYGRNSDPRMTMLAVNAYLNANQQAVGIRLFERVLERYGDEMADDVRAVYIAAYAILRATHADQVPLVRRIGWVLESFRHLEEARRLTGGNHPIVRWAAGQIYAQVPWFFFKKRQAYADLTWLSERPETAPVLGFYREVHRQLARLNAGKHDKGAAKRAWHRTGFGANDPKALFMGWFTSTREGATMSPEPTLREVVPGRIFALFGFGFSDIYFLLSDDRQELIAIDAGTQPHLLQAAHEFLLSRHPDLPRITTALITHAHWDHIGGHAYLHAQNPDIRIYGRENFRQVVDRVLRTHSYTHFRGADFDPSWVAGYAPDVAVSARTEITIGATRIDLIPVTGGETEDAMLIHVPGLSTVFVGDVVMPWYGEPWVNEGFVGDAAETMDVVISLGATHILHGHHPLTGLYGPEALPAFRDAYAWLVENVRDHLRHGYSAKDIVRLNLIPPGFQNHPQAYLAYAAARDNVIARIADQMTGIWQEDISGQEPQGLDQITSIEYARMLGDYLGLTQRGTVRMLRRMLANGDNELALRFAVAAERRFGAIDPILALKREAADRLRSAAQFFDPFRFVAYTELSGQEHRPMPAA